MKYRTITKVNGKYYPAGAEVPEGPSAEPEGKPEVMPPAAPTDTPEDGEEITEEEAGKPEIGGESLDEMTLEELKAYAGEQGINLGRATTADSIRKKIIEAGEPDGGEALE